MLGLKNDMVGSELPTIACSSSGHSAMCHSHTWPRLGGHHAAFVKQLSQLHKFAPSVVSESHKCHMCHFEDIRGGN